LTFVEAAEDGWWYSAPLPDNRRVLAFHTDADLPSARIARDREAMLHHARSATHLRELLSSVKFAPDHTFGFTAAHSAHLSPCTGEGWLATGDAALNFDPLSSQGLFNALYTGLAAAEATERRLSNAADALSDYEAAIGNIRTAYAAQLGLWYRAETRWQNSPFWHRRIKAGPENARAETSGLQ